MAIFQNQGWKFILSVLILLSNNQFTNNTRSTRFCAMTRHYLREGETYHVSIRTKDVIMPLTKTKIKCTMKLKTCSYCHLVFTVRGISSMPCNPQEHCSCSSLKFIQPASTEAEPLFCITNSNDKSTYESRSKTVIIEYTNQYLQLVSIALNVTSSKNTYTYEGHSKQHLSSWNGYVKSFNFPSEYPHDYSAEYIFRNLNADGCIRLYFIDFQLAPLSSLKVFDNSSELAEFTGRSEFRPPILTSSGPVLSIQFDANGQQLAPGFRVEYTFISYFDTFQLPKPTTDCGGYKEDYGGIITITGKEEMETVYDCIWLIHAPLFTTPLTYFAIKIAFFKDVDPGSVVEMRKGLSSESKLIKTINLNDIIKPDEFVFPANDGLFIRFKAALTKKSKITLTYSAFKYMDCLFSEEFHCNNSRCISETLKCDGYDHCGDFSDEWYCTEKISSTARPADKDVWIPKTQKMLSPGAASLILVIGIAGLGICVSTTTAVILTRLCKQRIRLSPDQEQLLTVSGEIDTEDCDERFDSCDPPAYRPPPSYEEVMKHYSPPPYIVRSESYDAVSSQPESPNSHRSEVFSVVGLVQN